MDIIVIVMLFILPFIGGWVFLIHGFNDLNGYNPEWDEPNKKHGAILDIILGIVLLLFFNGLFWATRCGGFYGRKD